MMSREAAPGLTAAWRTKPPYSGPIEAVAPSSDEYRGREHTEPRRVFDGDVEQRIVRLIPCDRLRKQASVVVPLLEERFLK